MNKGTIIVILLVINLITSGFLLLITNNTMSIVKEKTAVIETLLYDLDEDIHELHEKY